jgi:hypothetical protein
MRAIWSRHDWDGEKRLRGWDGNSWEGEIDLGEEKDEGAALGCLERYLGISWFFFLWILLFFLLLDTLFYCSNIFKIKYFI